MLQGSGCAFTAQGGFACDGEREEEEAGFLVQTKEMFGAAAAASRPGWTPETVREASPPGVVIPAPEPERDRRRPMLLRSFGAPIATPLSKDDAERRL